MPRSAGPLIPRRRFGGEIKRLREARGETLADTAGALLISTSKLSRLENGQGELRPRDVRDLLAYFDIGDAAEGAQLREWAEQARVPGWWQGETYVMPPKLDTFIAYENAASRIKSYVPTVVPGWLQTRRYAAAALTRLAPLSAVQVEHQADLRMARQEALRERASPPTMLLAIPETVLHRTVGGPEVMREQVDALIASYDDPLVDLHIIPFSAGLYPAMEGGFTIFAFEDELDPDVAALDLVSAIQFLTDEGRVREHQEILEDLRHYWLDRTDSQEFLLRFTIDDEG